jgi:hypothetical protein
VPNELLEKLGAKIQYKRGYHLSEKEISPTYCSVQKNVFDAAMVQQLPKLRWQ